MWQRRLRECSVRSEVDVGMVIVTVFVRCCTTRIRNPLDVLKAGIRFEERL